MRSGVLALPAAGDPLVLRALVLPAALVASLADVEHRLAVGTSEKIQLAGVVGIFMQSKAAIIAAQA